MRSATPEKLAPSIDDAVDGDPTQIQPLPALEKWSHKHRQIEKRERAAGLKWTRMTEASSSVSITKIELYAPETVAPGKRLQRSRNCCRKLPRRTIELVGAKL